MMPQLSRTVEAASHTGHGCRAGTDRLACAPMRRLLRFSSLVWLALTASVTSASPLRFVPVDDPIVPELRVLDLASGADAREGWRLVHLDAGPWQVLELTDGASAPPLAGARGIALARIARALAIDRAGADASVPGATPRLWQRAWPGDERAEFSLGLEGEGAFARAGDARTSRWADGSGLHARVGLQSDRWLLYSHLVFGQWRGVRTFSDALVANTDLAASTEESYMAYAPGRAWSLQLGRSRWAWGPGESGSLLLSRTAPAMNGVLLHLRLDGLRADAFVLDATVEPGAGEQLAAHRLEWQPADGVRLGLAEAARYHAGGWQGVYLAGVIPYSVAQRLLDHEHADSAGPLRNNVMVAADASVRVADGVRVYGELLLDDVHARTASVPNKYGGQLGVSGTGAIGRSRVTWTAETTWLSRWVYTSFFGRDYEAQGVPLGYPTGPDSRAFVSRVAWDPDADWQFALAASRTRNGEADLARPFVPGAPVPNVATLAGVAEQTRVLEASARWWPARGLDASVRVAREWTANAAHVAGADVRRWRGTIAIAIAR